MHGVEEYGTVVRGENKLDIGLSTLLVGCHRLDNAENLPWALLDALMSKIETRLAGSTVSIHDVGKQR